MKLAALILLIILFGFLSKPPATFAASSYATQSAELSVQAQVYPKPKDFQFGFTSDLTASAATADQEIEYTITYGSRVSYGTPMTITASWSLGTVREENLTNYEIVAYVAGSATRDYWGTSVPVVDLKNRTITWTITRFPPNTLDKTLKFKLKTPGRYVTDKQVAFTVRAAMSTSQIGVGEITLDQLYNPTEFIRKEVSGLRILSVDIRQITDTSFTVFFVTSVPTTATIYYGTSPDELTGALTDSLFSDQKTFTIDGLTPSTTYYFRILIENENGIQRKTPESFMVTTAADSLLSLIDQDRLIISSQGVSLSPEFGREGKTILVPVKKAVDFYIPFIKSPPASVFLTIGDTNVLGATTELNPPQVQKIRLLETQYKVFTGRLTSPLTPGRYAIYIEARSPEGWINQDVLTVMTASIPITISDPEGAPVEKALVYIQTYDKVSKEYIRFPAESYGSINPQWSGPGGTIDAVLPEGEYKLTVNALGFAPKEEKLYLLPGQEATYPKITLDRAPFSLMSFVTYYSLALRDLFSHLDDVVAGIGTSYRYLDVGLLTALSILTILSTLLNLQRLKLTLRGAYTKIYRHLEKSLWHRPSDNLFIGFVEDELSMPVAGVFVTAVKDSDGKITRRDVTNLVGSFEIPLASGETYTLQLVKPGYRKVSVPLDFRALVTTPPPFKIVRQKRIQLPESLLFTEELVRSILHAVSDLILFGTGILTLWLTVRLGLGKTLLLFILTAVNTLLWLDYQYQRFRIRFENPN